MYVLSSSPTWPESTFYHNSELSAEEFEFVFILSSVLPVLFWNLAPCVSVALCPAFVLFPRPCVRLHLFLMCFTCVQSSLPPPPYVYKSLCFSFAVMFPLFHPSLCAAPHVADPWHLSIGIENCKQHVTLFSVFHWSHTITCMRICVGYLPLMSDCSTVSFSW